MRKGVNGIFPWITVTGALLILSRFQTETPTGSPGKRIPFQDHMVKRFNRSSAGKEEELPSDVRPPLILQVQSIPNLEGNRD